MKVTEIGSDFNYFAIVWDTLGPRSLGAKFRNWYYPVFLTMDEEGESTPDFRGIEQKCHA